MDGSTLAYCPNRPNSTPTDQLIHKGPLILTQFITPKTHRFGLIHKPTACPVSSFTNIYPTPFPWSFKSN